MSDQPQAAESMTDRVLAQFGVDPNESPEPEPTETEPQEAEAPNPEEVEAPEAEFAEVEYDGAKYQVPKGLEKAILQQKDYTQKTQKLADRERQYEVLQERGRIQAERAAFESAVTEDVNRLRAYDSVLAEARKIDWASMSSEDLIRKKAQLDTWREERNELEQSLQVKHQQWKAQHEETVNSVRTKALDVISKSIPNWQEIQKDVRTHAKSEGYADADLNHIDLDPRIATTLYKAMQYDKLMASKAQAVQTAKAAPPMVKPGTSRPMPQGVKNDLALKKAQASATNSADRAKIIQKRLEGRF